MQQKNSLIEVAGYLWKTLLCAFVFASGLVISRIFFYKINVIYPHLPQQADESIAIYFLLTGSLILIAGLTPLIERIDGIYLTRLFIAFLFLYVSFGINISVENAIYSISEGHYLMILYLFLPCLLTSFAMVSLYKPKNESEQLSVRSKQFFKPRTLEQWVWRCIIAIIAFPLVYFIFGLIVSPIVVDYYRSGSYGLALPDIEVILLVQLFRSLLFVLVSLPVMIMWVGSRTQLIVLLGIAYFVFVFSYDIVLAYQYPSILRITHGVEILADSIVYAFLIVKLLAPKEIIKNHI